MPYVGWKKEDTVVREVFESSAKLQITANETYIVNEMVHEVIVYCVKGSAQGAGGGGVLPWLEYM